jgi:LmbE family N-acetylglucosaminyl deacetylase
MTQEIAGLGTREEEWRRWAGWRDMPELRLPPAAGGARAVVVAPHPDDEILGSGGTLAVLASLGYQPVLVAVTDGTASHPGSAYWTPARLLAVRPGESAAALGRMGLAHAQIVRLGIPDGRIGDFGTLLRGLLETLLRSDDVVLSTWCGDGHPDHEACGRAAVAAATAVGATSMEMPIWAWHWSRPGDPRFPWQRARRISLGPEAVERKARAIAAFESQVRADPSPPHDCILPPPVLQRFLRPYEVVFV